MDFNPLMLLAGNLPSIIQGSEEEGRRKAKVRGRQGRKGGKVWRKGNRKEGGRDRDVGVSHGKVLPPIHTLSVTQQQPLLSFTNDTQAQRRMRRRVADSRT